MTSTRARSGRATRRRSTQADGTRSRWRRGARWAVLALGAVLLALVGAVLLLAAGNPSPSPRPGWQAGPALPGPRGEGSSTVVQRGGRDVLVVVGGLEGLPARAGTAVHLFDLEAGEGWQRLPDLPEPRHHSGAAAVGGDIYVSGGAPSVTEWIPQDALWVLREGAASWETLTPMPEGREGHRMRVLDGRLHVIGGNGESADILVYHTDTDRWERAAPLPAPRHHLAVVVREGEVWAVGGRDHHETVLDAVHVWDPDTDTWRDGPTLPHPLSAAVEGVLDDSIHIIGGEDPALLGGGALDDHLVLDPGSDTWRSAAPAPLPVHGAGGGVLDGRLAVAGGARRQGALSMLSWTDHVAMYDPSP